MYIFLWKLSSVRLLCKYRFSERCSFYFFASFLSLLDIYPCISIDVISAVVNVFTFFFLAVSSFVRDFLICCHIFFSGLYVHDCCLYWRIIVSRRWWRFGRVRGIVEGYRCAIWSKIRKPEIQYKLASSVDVRSKRDGHVESGSCEGNSVSHMSSLRFQEYGVLIESC